MSKVKSTTVTNSIKDPDLIEMFNQMVGTSTPDPNIALPKYNKILKLSEDVLKILKSFIESPVCSSFHGFESGFSSITEFVKKSELQLKEFKLEKNDKILNSEELDEINKNPEKLAEYIKLIGMEYKMQDFADKYNKLKENIVVKEIVMIAKNLKNLLKLQQDRDKHPHHNLEVREKLSASFIIESDGDYLQIFNFTKLDFKQLYLSEMMDKTKSNYILYALHILHNKSFEMVQLLTSPDIDSDKFAHTMIGYIDDISKKIPRCTKAFNVIKGSVGLFKENFGGYYKDFVISKNPAIIIEDFVVDVANNNRSNPEITRQFREITSFCRKNTTGKVTDPRISKMFDMVSGNMDILEKDDGKDKEVITKE
jgi:hypothetical protein